MGRGVGAWFAWSTIAFTASCLGIGGADSGTAGGGTGATGISGGGGFPSGGKGGKGGTGASGGSTSGGSGGTTSGGSAGTPSGGGTSGAGAGGLPTGGGGTSTGGQPGGANLYTYHVNSNSWTSLPLANVWSGANAPPSSGIIAVAQLEQFDRLLVFTSDGTFYLRKDGLWQTPVPTVQAFGALSGLNLDGVYHVSSPPGAPPDEGLTFVANPTAVAYAYHSNDAIVFETQVTMKDDPPPAAPQGSGTLVFTFEVRDPSKYQTADYYYFYSLYTDGNLYRFDAAFNWVATPVTQSTYFSAPGAPDATTLTAAWYDQGLGQAEFVGP